MAKKITTAPSPATLAGSWKKVTTLLASVSPAVLQGLRPPAPPSEVEALAARVGKLPEALTMWFGWHDGFALDALLTTKGPGFDPDRPAHTLCSIQEALATWAFLEEEAELPWSRDWLPLADNGGGDHIVYVLRGERAGQLVQYFHDDAKRPVVARTLDAYLKAVARRLAAIAADQKLASRVPRHISVPAGTTWTDVAAPSLDELRAAPLGAAYCTRSLPYRSFWCCVRVKVAESLWVEGSAQNGRPWTERDGRVGPAIDAACKRLREELPKDWGLSDDDLAVRLSDAKTFPTGVLALDGRDPKTDPYFFRRFARCLVGEAADAGSKDEDPRPRRVQTVPIPDDAVRAEDGQWELGETRDGVHVGRWRWWSPDGDYLACEATYEEGRMARLVMYHPDGTVAQSYTRKPGGAAEWHGTQTFHRSQHASPRAFPLGADDCWTLRYDIVEGAPQPGKAFDREGRELKLF